MLSEAGMQNQNIREGEMIIYRFISSAQSPEMLKNNSKTTH